MKKEELITLQNSVRDEQKKRKRNNELIKNELVQEFIKIHRLGIADESLDIESILKYVLKHFEIQETNHIYVLTKVYETRIEDYFENFEYECIVDFDSIHATHKEYKDIENCESVKAYIDPKNAKITGFYSKDFEEKYIVLNPNNNKDNNNDYDKVRKEFLLNSLIEGQENAIKKLLKKYPRV